MVDGGAFFFLTVAVMSRFSDANLSSLVFLGDNVISERLVYRNVEVNYSNFERRGTQLSMQARGQQP